MAVSVKMEKGELLGAGSFLTDKENFDLVLIGKGENPLTLLVEFKTNSARPPNEYVLEGTGGDKAKLTLVNYRGVEAGMGPLEFGTVGNRKITFFIWTSRLDEHIRRIEYSFFDEEAASDGR